MAGKKNRGPGRSRVFIVESWDCYSDATAAPPELEVVVAVRVVG